MATGLQELATAPNVLPHHFLTEQQLAARWNVVPRTIQRMVRDGALRPLLVRHAPRFALADIEVYEARRLAPETVTPEASFNEARAVPVRPLQREREPQTAGQQPYI